MTTVNVNSVTINSISGSGRGPFQGKGTIVSVDLNNAPWTNNSMYSAFQSCTNLTSVTNINQNVIDMNSTFTSCYNLVNAPVIPNSVTNMYGTFSSCNNLVNAPVIPNSVTEMSYTFFYCSNLVNAPVIPNSVTNMFRTFYNCYNLVNAPVIPNSVTYMSNTFTSCYNLVNAPVIPNSVTDLGCTFQFCTNLTGNIYINDIKVNYARDCFSGTTLQKNVFIPYNTELEIYTPTYNAFYPFYGSGQNGVTLMEHPAFIKNGDWWCDSADGIIYKYLGTSADITVPNVINGKSSTVDAISNTWINFPKTIINSIDFNNAYVSNLAYLFYGCSNLKSVININLDSPITNVRQTFYGCYNLVNAPIIPNSVIDMGYAFYYCNKLVNAPAIPNSVINMYGTFQGCSNLVNVPVIPNSVINMTATFSGCSNLVNVPVIPNSVINMGGTFQQCSNLVNAPVIPNSVINMGDTFQSCINLEGNIYIHSENITNAERCFYLTIKTKNVYIPFKYANNVNTLTYNTFIVAGYKIDGSVNGVYLKDINEL